MEPIFNCLIEFYPSPHLSQIYDGFWKLNQRGLIKLKSKRINPDNGKPIIKVIVDGKFTLIYDTLDGLNWIDGSLEDNLEFFKKHYACDFYFKRSYNNELKEYFKGRNIYPLGLNFPYDYEGNFPLTIQERLQLFFKKNFKNNNFKLTSYEYPPILNKENKILFFCGLWNPNEVTSSELREQREQINHNRIELIRKCKMEFGSNFTGGIQLTNYSRSVAKEFLVSDEITNKGNFINNIKSHNICIATSGLHNSIGWKFAEYVAASRAIVSEPLNFEVPGNFRDKNNYLTFNSPSELIDCINQLIIEKNTIQSMMYENYRYYNNYLNSEKLILNTLLKIKCNY